jgi:hypothetical protein
VKAVEYSAGPNSHGKVETYQYVPVTLTLKALLMNEDVQSEVFNGHLSNDVYIRDFCDGKLFAEHGGFVDNPHALQIQLHYDEFVVCNPLGNMISQCKDQCILLCIRQSCTTTKVKARCNPTPCSVSTPNSKNKWV